MMINARKGVRGAVEYVMMAHRHHLQLNSVKSTSEGNSLRCGARYFLHGTRVAVIWRLPPFGPRPPRQPYGAFHCWHQRFTQCITKTITV